MAWHALIKLHMKPLLTIQKIQYTKALEWIIFIKRGITVFQKYTTTSVKCESLKS